jgi:1-acyl-sn-glycerol-3-phosphate acyltransferase
MNLTYFITQLLSREISHGLFGLTLLGLEHTRFEGPALIASNHVSYFDPPFIGAAFDEDICYLAKKSLFQHPIANAVLTQLQAIPVDREKADPGSMKMVLRRLRDGKKVIIFPEGTRSLDGALLPGEPGVGMLIARAKVPVLPVRIFGAHKALPRDKKLPQPARMTISFGAPWRYDASQFPDQGKTLYQDITNHVMQQIAALPETV